MTLPEILAELHKEAVRLLHANGIYDVLAHGRIDHDTLDGENIGHAMWQTWPPFEPGWTALIDGGKVPKRPTQRDEILTLNGEDFIGTIIFARRSIGLALCYVHGAKADFAMENEAFWQEYASSLQWLNIAADRLREFFVMVAFGVTTTIAM